MRGDTEEGKLKTILDQLEKLDEFSQDTYLKLREFDDRVFGNVFIEAENEREKPLASSTPDLCEIMFWHIKRIGNSITSISLRTDTMILQLPEVPKTIMPVDHRAKHEESAF